MRHEFGVLQRAVRGIRDAAGLPAAGGDGDGVPRGPDHPADRSGRRRRCRSAAAEARFEVAARWREKFEQLEWLLAATSRARSRARPAHLRLPRSRRFRRRPGLPRPPGRGAGVVSLSRPRRSSARPSAPSWPKRRPGRRRRRARSRSSRSTRSCCSCPGSGPTRRRSAGRRRTPSGPPERQPRPSRRRDVRRQGTAPLSTCM